MNKLNKTLLLVLALVAVIAIAALGYRYLGSRVTPESGLGSEQSAGSGEAGAGGEAAEPESGESEEAQQAMDFKVYDADGNAVTLNEQLGQGKPVVVNFWASWCGPCKGEMPDFNEVYEEYGDRVIFMMVNLTDGSRETQEKAQALVDEAGYTFPVYFDLDSNAAYTYSVYSIPTTLVINSDGFVEGYAQGTVSGEALADALDAVLAKAA